MDLLEVLRPAILDYIIKYVFEEGVFTDPGIKGIGQGLYVVEIMDVVHWAKLVKRALAVGCWQLGWWINADAAQNFALTGLCQIDNI